MKYPGNERLGESEQFEHPGQVIFFLDIETTGLDPIRNEIIVASIGAYSHDTAELLDEIELDMKPEYSDFASRQAEEVNGISRLEYLMFPERKGQLVKMLEFFEKNKGPTNPLLCFHALEFCGNWFDWLILTNDMKAIEGANLEIRLRQTFKDGYLRSTVNYARKALKSGRIEARNCKLNTLCDLFDIKLEHHKAKSDRNACKEVYFFLRGLVEIC